jgi:hypothetical protein
MFRVVASVREPTLGAGVPRIWPCYRHLVLARADTLASLTVLDEKGSEVPLASLWRDRTAVLALVRHFG